MNEDDKRGSSRREITRSVRMATGLGPGLECGLKDISNTGARIEVDDANSVPQEFLIKLNKDLLRWCQVMWRSEKEVGLRFIGTPRSVGVKGANAPQVASAQVVSQPTNGVASGAIASKVESTQQPREKLAG
jgi:hypothetical protein